MIEHAFANRTDTLATWGLLQENCLLIKAEEEQERRARQGSSTLTRRLRQARADREAANKAKGRTSGSKKSVIRRLPQARKLHEEALEARAEQQADKSGDVDIVSPQSPDYLQPVSRSRSSPSQFQNNLRSRSIGASDAVPETPASSSRHIHSTRQPQQPCWLTIRGSQRHISLPQTGELILGRFDAAIGIPPDVDLAYEDQGQGTISRRHAKIVGRFGHHTIEDMGSRHGTLVNGERVSPGAAQPLQSGDRVAVGTIQMSYSQVPPDVQNITQIPHIRHTLVVAPTGRKLTISPPDDIVIGRSDRYIESVPDIDLSQDGEAAARVSRRHAMIRWRNNIPYLEDLGSGFGTRVNGEMILLGQAVPLKPGDHVWLGGCVLAYDIVL